MSICLHHFLNFMIRIEHLRQEESVFWRLEIDHSLVGEGSGILMMDFVAKHNKKRQSHSDHTFLFLFNTSLEWVEILSNIRIRWWDWKEICWPFFRSTAEIHFPENVLNIGIHHICPISTLFKCTFSCRFLHSCFRLPPIFCREPLYKKGQKKSENRLVSCVTEWNSYVNKWDENQLTWANK